MLRAIWLVGAALAVSITASAQRVLSADEIAEAGAFDGQLYTNKALGLTILAPGGWAFYTYNQNQALVNANRTKNASAASANTQVLFQAMPPKGLGPGKTATLSAGVERLIKPTTAAVYSETNKKLLLTASPQLALTLDVKEEKHGDATFSVFEVSGKTDGQTYRQRYMATIRKGVAIFFVATFYDNKNEFAVEASLKTLKFGK